MWDHEVALRNALIAKQQYVHVDDARTPAQRRPAPARGFDLLGGNQQLARRARPLDLDDLIQESRLVGDTPRRRVNDATLTQDACTSLTQAPARGAEVSGAPAQVRAEAQVGGRQRMWSATRTTRDISR